MAKKSNWNDDYWLLVVQLYLRKPVGVKPLYSKALIDLCLEIHVSPSEVRAKMKAVEKLQLPRVERLWRTYSGNPAKLRRAVELLRQMKGFGNANAFFEGVAVNEESFERDFRHIGSTGVTPVILILVLDLYFRLTPITMVPETPEVVELAKLVKLSPATIADLLHLFRCQDPMFSSSLTSSSSPLAPNLTPLIPNIKSIWRRYGNGDTEALAQLARELKEYYSSL